MEPLVQDLPKENDLDCLVLQTETGEIRNAAELEAELIERLRQAPDNPEESLAGLADLYKRTHNFALAAAYTESLLARARDDELRARMCLRRGQIAELQVRWDDALSWYHRGLKCQPQSRFIAYFLLNNAAYCLNQRGQFEPAENLCRMAISSDATHYNAFKNLGVALEGQGRYREAAEAYMEAVRRSETDLRSLRHLEDLLGRHPELASAVRDLASVREALLERWRLSEEHRRRLLMEMWKEYPSMPSGPAS